MRPEYTKGLMYSMRLFCTRRNLRGKKQALYVLCELVLDVGFKGSEAASIIAAFAPYVRLGRGGGRVW